MIIDDIFHLPVTKNLSPLVNICSFLFSHHPAQNRTSFCCNALLFRGNLRRSGREVGENLIAVTLACPSTTKATLLFRGLRYEYESYPYHKKFRPSAL